MRRLARPLAESLLGGELAFGPVAKATRPRALVIAFHNILPEGVEPRGDRSLHLPVTSFRELIDWLADTFAVVSLDTVLSGSPEERPRAAITFDDAYDGAISCGIPELQRRGLPATVFVVSGAGSRQTFWWDALADASSGGLASGVREAALTEALGREEDVRRWSKAQGLSMNEMSGVFVSASWEDIERAATLPGIAIGSHTRSHANLAALRRDDVEAELRKSKKELAERLPSTRPWLAYPYGRSSRDVEQASATAGYEMAFRVSGGAVLWRDGGPTDNHRLPRLNVPAGLSLAGFRMRAAGLLGR
jgi:peptidoglycan/xylan/chitin deacetylase (PgdA/CDA1 family)